MIRGERVRLPGLIVAAVVVAWLVALGAGFRLLERYANRPGVAATPPGRWPARSRLRRTPARATLVMLVHPGCPCSRASLEELDRLMARSAGRLDAHVLFFKPGDVDDDWAKTDLWRRAAAIPRVAVDLDVNGFEAGLFGSATSGQVVLYDRTGALLFSGGITPSRGHVGDSSGRAILLGLLTGVEAEPARSTPVFGCSLRDPDPSDRAAGTNDGF